MGRSREAHEKAPTLQRAHFDAHVNRLQIHTVHTQAYSTGGVSACE